MNKKKVIVTSVLAIILVVTFILSLSLCLKSTVQQVEEETLYNLSGGSYYYKGVVYHHEWVYLGFNKSGVSEKFDLLVMKFNIVDDSLYIMSCDESDETKPFYDWVLYKLDLDGGNKTELFRRESTMLRDDYIFESNFPMFDETQKAYYYFVNQDNTQSLYRYKIGDNEAVNVASYDDIEMNFVHTAWTGQSEKYIWLSKDNYPQDSNYYQIDKKTWQLKEVDDIPRKEETDIVSDGYTYYIKDEITLYRKLAADGAEEKITDLIDIVEYWGDENEDDITIAGIENGRVVVSIHNNVVKTILKSVHLIDIKTGEKTKIY